MPKISQIVCMRRLRQERNRLRRSVCCRHVRLSASRRWCPWACLRCGNGPDRPICRSWGENQWCMLPDEISWCWWTEVAYHARRLAWLAAKRGQQRNKWAAQTSPYVTILLLLILCISQGSVATQLRCDEKYNNGQMYCSVQRWSRGRNLPMSGLRLTWHVFLTHRVTKLPNAAHCGEDKYYYRSGTSNDVTRRSREPVKTLYIGKWHTIVPLA